MEQEEASGGNDGSTSGMVKRVIKTRKETWKQYQDYTQTVRRCDCPLQSLLNVVAKAKA